METAKERSAYEGQVFYFGSDQCRNKFDEDLSRFVNRADSKSVE